MSSEIEIGVGLAKLKITLSEFAAVVRNLAGEAKQQEVKNAIKEMIEATRASYDTTVDVFTPLYSLNSEDTFNAEFADIRSNFKNKYLKDIGAVRTHCSIVEAKLENLTNQKRMMRNIPIINRSFKRLNSLAAAWLDQDYELDRDMEKFLLDINNFLDVISDTQQNNPSEAFQELRWSLTQFEDDFLTTKDRLNEITVLSSQL